jgi:hypothetical protein
LNRSVGITAIHSISTISAGSARRLTPINALVGKSVLKYVTVVVYAMVFVYVGGESRRLYDIGLIAAIHAHAGLFLADLLQ